MKNLFLGLIVTSFFVGCHSKNDEQKAAVAFLENVEQQIKTAQYNAATLALDSFHLCYPQQIALRRRALALADTVFLFQSRRTLAFCDSVLPLVQQQRDSLKTQFRFEKDEKYEAIGKFVHRSQPVFTFDNNIYVYVDESGDFYLTFSVRGTAMQNAFLTVSMGDFYASTDTLPLESPARHRFEADGSMVETLTFHNEQVEGFAEFVRNFAAENLKIAFNGKSNHAYSISPATKQAIASTFNLWKVIRTVENWEKEKIKALRKIKSME